MDTIQFCIQILAYFAKKKAEPVTGLCLLHFYLTELWLITETLLCTLTTVTLIKGFAKRSPLSFCPWNAPEMDNSNVINNAGSPPFFLLDFFTFFGILTSWLKEAVSQKIALGAAKILKSDQRINLQSHSLEIEATVLIKSKPHQTEPPASDLHWNQYIAVFTVIFCLVSHTLRMNE